MFRVLDVPWWYYAVATLIGVVVWKSWRWEGGILVGYAFFLIVETVLIRTPTSGEHFQPELFWSWKAWKTQKNQILTNVIMFIPLGTIAGLLWKWRGLIVAAGLSVVIEVLQLVSQRGLMEFDDIIHNCMGACIGIWIIVVASRINTKIDR